MRCYRFIFYFRWHDETCSNLKPFKIKNRLLSWIRGFSYDSLFF
jgi:hypothetical protein